MKIKFRSRVTPSIRLLFITLALASCQQAEAPSANLDDLNSVEKRAFTSDVEMQRIYDQKQHDQQIYIKGTVLSILSDDNEGSKHQRFILKLNSNQTILVAHNIDLADRIADLSIGDDVQVHGEYEWNEKGGVIHWTHHDPQGRHIDGWIKHHDQIYQ